MVVDIIVIALVAAVSTVDAVTIAAVVMTAAVIVTVVEAMDVDAAMIAITTNVATSVQIPGARHTTKTSTTNIGRTLVTPTRAGQAVLPSPGLREQNLVAATAGIKLLT